MNTKQIQLAHKIFQKLSIEHLTEMYNLLDVDAHNYDPESWYGGVPHPITGDILADGKYIEETIGKLFLSIAQHKPLCKEPYINTFKEPHENSFIVWPEGDNKPTYTHWKKGVNFLSDKEYDCHHFNKNEKYHHCGKSKGKLLSTGKYGLGVLYHAACVLWGKKIVDSLPLKIADSG